MAKRSDTLWENPNWPIKRTAARILSVDDEPANLKLIERILARNGYENVVSVADSRSVAALAYREDPDLIILDLNMPHLDGFGVMEELKTYSFSLPPPILVLTAQSDRATVHRAFQAGARDFVTKPFDAAELLMRVANLLDAHLGSRFLMEQTAVLEALVQQRTEALADSREDAIKARDRAIQANRAKSEFLANISHELRTPLNAILGLSEMIKGEMLGPIGTPIYAEYGADIHKSGSHLLTLINDILDLSKIEAGKLVIDPVPTDPRAMLDEIAEMLGPIARQKGIALTSWSDPEVVAKAAFDAMRVRQILLNLAGNALKFTQAGSVRLGVRPGIDDCLHFEVSDTGIGIDPAKLETIFDAFTQADNSTTRQFGGTGLGLAISRRLAVAMGGEIGCDSRFGEGAIFWFRIPVTVVEPPPSSGPARLDGVSILLIAGEDQAIGSLVGDLARCGASIHRIADGGAGITLAQADDPAFDVLIVAGDRSDMDGLEAARRIQWQRPSLRLMLASDTDMSVRRRAHQAGIDLVLAQPLPAQRLNWTIAQELRRRKTAKEPALPPPAAPGGDGDEGALQSDLPVLVIDDNPMNQMVARRQLEKLGLSCVVGGNGQEGLDLLAQHEVCLALVDCAMPVMDGREFTRRLRDREAGTGRHLSVVAMTANAFEGHAKKCFDAGMDDFITKPVLIDQLQAILRKWLPGSAGERKLAEQAESDGAPDSRTTPIDREKLAHILGEEDEATLNEILRFFLESGEPLMERVRAAVQAKDAGVLAADAHAAKGAARNAAALRLAEAMAALESAARDGAWSDLEGMFREAEAAFGEVRAYIRSLP